MRRSGVIGDYRWIEDDEASLKGLLTEFVLDLAGTRAINTSFDSGILGGNTFPLTQEDQNKGWSTINDRAVSPVLSEICLQDFLYTDAYDEWYFFDNVPNDFNAIALCNFVGLSLSRASELEFLEGPGLVQAIATHQPRAVAGWNDTLSYYIYRGA